MQQRPAALIEVLNLRSTATTSSEYDCDQEMCCKQDKECVCVWCVFSTVHSWTFKVTLLLKPLKSSLNCKVGTEGYKSTKKSIYKVFNVAHRQYIFTWIYKGITISKKKAWFFFFFDSVAFCVDLYAQLTENKATAKFKVTLMQCFIYTDVNGVKLPLTLGQSWVFSIALYANPGLPPLRSRWFISSSVASNLFYVLYTCIYVWIQRLSYIFTMIYRRHPLKCHSV